MTIRITTKGIGAHDQDLELRHHTLLVGPNGSGKSKLAEAIRMLALGYVPALGKRPVDLAALMHGESMSVELTMDGGRTIRRTLERRDQGYTASAEASWMRQAKPGEVSKAITKLFGNEELDVAECLDIRQLLAATPNQRCARMEELLNAAARSGDDIAKDVARLIVMRLAETTEDRMPPDYVEALPMVPDKQREILFEEAKMIKTKILEAGIGGALTWANAEKRDKSDGLKKKNAAAEELRKRAAQVPEPDERDIIRLEAEKKKLLVESGAVKQRWADYNLLAGTATRLQEQLKVTEEIAERVQKSAMDAEAVHGKAAKELREQSDQVLEKMSALKTPPEEDDSQVTKLQDEARTLALKAEAIDLPNIPDTIKHERAVADLKARIQMAEMSEWAEVLKIAEDIEGIGTSKGFKTALGKPLKKLREIAEKGLGANPAELKQDLTAASARLQEATEAKKKAEALREKAGAERIALCQQADQKTAEAIKIRAEINQRRRKALQDFDAQRAALAAERTKLERALETHKEALEIARQEHERTQRRVTSLRDQAKGAGELPAAPPDPMVIEGKLSAVDGELQKLIAARATHTEIHNVLNEIEAAKAGAVVFTAIEWALQRQREVEISSAGGPLIRTMNEFLKAAGRKETPFIRASQGLCTIGWKTADGREIQIQALSGGEWCLFAAALTTAVILCRKSVLKILLVEAGEADGRVLSQLLEGIQGVNKEELLTAIVMSPRAPDQRVDYLEGWDVIRVTEDKKAAAGAAA